MTAPALTIAGAVARGTFQEESEVLIMPPGHKLALVNSDDGWNRKLWGVYTALSNQSL